MKKKYGKNLAIASAIYYDPNIGSDNGTDVTSELSARILDNRLFYDGIYNNIFPDKFKRVYKRLKVEVEFEGKKHTKFYNENEKINFPSDLGLDGKRWWENTWIQAIILLGAVAGIIALRH